MVAGTSSFHQIRDALDAALATTMRELILSVQEETSVAYVKDSVAYLEKLVLSGGKRVRGVGAYQMYMSAGGKNTEVALQLGVALELFHLFALMHDDVIDRAASRRGVTTMHHFTEEWLRGKGRLGELGHIGNSQAILWGDFLLAISMAKMQSLDIAAQELQAVQAAFSRMFTEVLVGQIIDVDMTTRPSVTHAELFEKTLLKSTLYTFVRPMQIGAAAAGGSQTWHDFSEVFGRALGMAFQIQDDLFDVTRTEAEFMKPVLNDIQEGAHTILTNYILEEGAPEHQEQLRKFLGTKLSEKELAAARKLYQDSGAIARAEQEIAEYFNQAQHALDTLQSEDQAPWQELLMLMQKRTK